MELSFKGETDVSWSNLFLTLKSEAFRNRKNVESTAASGARRDARLKTASALSFCLFKMVSFP